MPFKPVLMLLTSRHPETFRLCLEALETHTDMSCFKAVYILANAVSKAHNELIQDFKARHSQATDIHCSPLGLMPCGVRMQNQVMAYHREDVILKMDDDLFVTPGWLESLVTTFEKYRYSDFGIISPVIPINLAGDRYLRRFYWKHKPGALEVFNEHDFKTLSAEYSAWIWNCWVRDDFAAIYHAEAKRPVHHLTKNDFLAIQCVMFDERAMRLLYPFPEEGIENTDERLFNTLIHTGCVRAILDTSVICHHYSYNSQRKFMLTRMPLEEVASYIGGLETGTDVPHKAGRPLDAHPESHEP
jgi:hypothetical protein